MADKFDFFPGSVADPARGAVAVTPDDDKDLPDVPVALYVGTGGDIAMVGMDAPRAAPAVVWKNVVAGSVLPFRPRRILADGTTAADLLALY